MEIYGSKNQRRGAAGLVLVLLLCIAALPGCSVLRRMRGEESASQEKSPPKPQQPSSTLALPNRVEAEEVKGQAAVPENVTMGFAVDLNERVARGNLDVQATVTNVDERTVIFRTDKGETGRLVYRLPQGLRLNIKTGQNVSIKREVIAVDVSQGYQLTVASEGSTLLSSGRLLGASPLEVKVSKDSVLRQNPERKTQVSESKYETTYNVPVMLVSGGQPGEASVGKLTEMRLEGTGFTILVRESALIVPGKGMEGVLEGGGYVLEYALTRSAEQPNPTATDQPPTQ
jgi:hypothetical protein